MIDTDKTELFRRARMQNHTLIERQIYLADMNNEWDLKNQRDYAIAEGMEKGLAEGKIEERLAIARKMKAIGMSIADIVKVTSLSEEEVNNL